SLEAVNASFHLFHSLPPAPGREPLPSTPEEFSALVDFHAALTALASHPALMRSVGLVLDVALPLDLVSAVGDGEVRLAVEMVLPGAGWELEPRSMPVETACMLERGVSGRATRFAAAPTTGAAGDVIDGVLQLGDAFALVPIDVDGALHSLAAAAE